MRKVVSTLIGTLILVGIALQLTFAATTVPYTVSYSARLTNSSGSPVTTAQDVRFSIWSGSDFIAADLLGSGAIDPAAPGFTGWEEIHSVTPDSNGLFQVRLGSITPLPNFNSTSDVNLQVDVKPSGTPLTSFEVLDPDGDTANTTDRFPLDASAFAINADTLDNHDAGTDAGQVPFLDLGGQLPISTTPAGTNSDTFTIDNDNTAGAGPVSLQFGNALGKLLEYDNTLGAFNFNDKVNIDGDITTTGDIVTTGDITTTGNITSGTINGVTITPTSVGFYDQSITYDPQYGAGVIQQDTANVGGNNGKLEELFSVIDKINHYHWTTSQGTLQDIFLVIQAKVPDGFDSWQVTPIEFTYRTGTVASADNKLDISMTDTTGTAVALSGASALTSTTFATTPITFTGSPTFTPGQSFTITVKLSATNAGSADAGRLKLNYNGR